MALKVVFSSKKSEEISSFVVSRSLLRTVKDTNESMPTSTKSVDELISSGSMSISAAIVERMRLIILLKPQTVMSSSSGLEEAGSVSRPGVVMPGLEAAVELSRLIHLRFPPRHCLPCP